MKKLLISLILSAFLVSSASAASLTGDGIQGGGSGVVKTDTDCNQAAYYADGTLCQDTDDNKLYLGTGAAVVWIGTGTTATNVTVADTADTTTFPMLATDAAADVAPKTDGALTYNANTGLLSATLFSGALNGTVGATTPAAGAFTTITGTSSATLGAVGSTLGSVVLKGTTSGTVTATTDATATKLTVDVPIEAALNGTVGATTPSTGVFTTLTSTKQIYAAPTDLTIASDAITLTQTFHTVDTETDAATDWIKTITAGTDGQRACLLAANAARIATIDETGNCAIDAGSTRALSTTQCTWMIYSAAASKWLVDGLPDTINLTIDQTGATNPIPWTVSDTAAANTGEGTAYWESDLEKLRIGDGATGIELDFTANKVYTFPSDTATLATTTHTAQYSATPVIDDADNFPANFAGDNLYGGTFIVNAAGTAVLPEPAVGMNFTIVLEAAAATIIDPLGTGTADTIYMNGLAAAADENITSSTVGAICVFQYRAANTWMATCKSFVEATPP